MASKDSNTTGNEGPFRFMDLPRELRDAILDELAVDIAVNSKVLCLRNQSDYAHFPTLDDDFDKSALAPYPDREASFTLGTTPVTSCFTVSQQFSREYKESLERNNPTIALKMTDRNQCFLRTSIVPEDILGHIKSLELQLVVECDDYVTYDFKSSHLANCKCWRQMRVHVRNIARNFATLISAIGSCQVELCVRGPRMMGEESVAELESILRRLTRMEGVRSIEVLHFPDDITGDGKDVLHCYEPESGPYASWTPDGGWMHHETEAVPWRKVAEVEGDLRKRPIWADERSE